MPQTLNVKSGGSWRTAKGVFVKSGGSWRTCQKVFVKVAGVWQQVYSNFIIWSHGYVSLVNTGPTLATRYVYLNLYNDASAATTPTSVYTSWGQPITTGVGSGWSARLTNTSIAYTLTNYTSGTWYSLATGKSFDWHNGSTVSEGVGQATLEFSPDGGSTVYAGGTIAWDVGYAP